MKTAVSSAFRKPASLFRRVGGLFSRIGPLLRRIGSPFRKLGPVLSRIGPVFWKIGSLLTKIGSLFRKAGSLLSRLVRKIWALPPFRRIDRALHRTRKEPKRLRYRFLPYVTAVLRVVGWAVLIIGVLASIVLGLEIINGGLMIWETEVRGVGIGVSAIILGIIGSFLAWLFLLVARELVCLFIHVKENTSSTAESIAE
ncbi:hypothetical protein ACFLXM_00440 [Chloroflexota bacterium]